MSYQQLDDIVDYSSDRRFVEERMASYALMRLYLKSKNLCDDFASWKSSMRDHALQILLRPIKGD